MRRYAVGDSNRAGRPAALRAHNLSLLLRAVADDGPLSRAELARRVGLTKATVSGLTEGLIDAGILEERVASPGDPARGRPPTPLGFSEGAPVALGCEVAVDACAVCAVDLAGRVRAQLRVPVDNRVGPPDQRLADLAALVVALGEKVNAEGCTVLGVGVAAPGIVDRAGVLRGAPNLPDWGSRALGAELAGGVTGRVEIASPGYWAVGNEANLAALGERWYGAGRTRADFLLISGEIGIGGGLVIGGRLFTGPRGAAGEFGHVSVDPRGPRCPCGSRGCVEQYAGLPALCRGAGVADAVALAAAAEAGAAEARDALESAGRALGRASAAVVNIVDVPTILLGGVYGRLAPFLTGAIAEELRVGVFTAHWSAIEVVAGELGDDAAVRGAAGLVIERFLDEPAAVVAALR